MLLDNSLDNDLEDGAANNEEGIPPSSCPVGEKRRLGRHQTTERMKMDKRKQ